MKILVISECYPTPEAPQYGIFIKQQFDELELLGNKIDVLVPSCTGHNGEIRKGKTSNCYTAEYKLFRYNLFPHIAAKKFYNELSALLEMKQYDLVSIHIVNDAILELTIDACNKLSIPIVAHCHGLNVWNEYTTKHKYREKWYANRRYRVLCRTQAIVGVSQKVMDIVKTRIKTVPLYTVYNGVDMDRFKTVDRLERDEICIIAIGNLIQIKGFQYLIPAFSRLAKEVNIMLHIIGDGVEKEKLKELAYEFHVIDKVFFHGKLPYDEVAESMQHSDLFVLPSFYEALGCVYLEAMACGVPAIGIKGMGIDEIIVDGENGYLAEPHNVEDLYEKMKRAVQDKQVLAKMGEAAYKTASKYTWAASAKFLNEIYQGLIE